DLGHGPPVRAEVRRGQVRKRPALQGVEGPTPRASRRPCPSASMTTSVAVVAHPERLASALLLRDQVQADHVSVDHFGRDEQWNHQEALDALARAPSGTDGASTHPRACGACTAEPDAGQSPRPASTRRWFAALWRTPTVTGPSGSPPAHCGTPLGYPSRASTRRLCCSTCVARPVPRTRRSPTGADSGASPSTTHTRRSSTTATSDASFMHVSSTSLAGRGDSRRRAE